MRRFKNMRWRAWLATFVCCLFVAVATSGCASRETGEMAAGRESYLVQGVVQEISPAAGMLLVKPNKEKAVRLVIDQETSFAGVSSAAAIEKRQRVKAWYILDGEQNRAVKIEKMPDLGC
jgi:predicted component of type VI protein secretion system